MKHRIAAAAGALLLVLAPALTADAAGGATQKKRTTTLSGLSSSIQSSAVRSARSHTGGKNLSGSGGTAQSGPSDFELDVYCDGDWFVTWDEDANGTPIIGTFNLYCNGDTLRIG
ncbi:MAG: hypothetical protein U0821_22195 [Chloroflexota bacterium]